LNPLFSKNSLSLGVKGKGK